LQRGGGNKLKSSHSHGLGAILVRCLDAKMLRCKVCYYKSSLRAIAWQSSENCHPEFNSGSINVDLEPLTRISNAHIHLQRTAPSPTRGEGKEGSVVVMKENNFPDTDFSRFTSHFSLRKAAFTLAEVLVTLGIIGIVAAMTMPTLMANHRKKVVETKLEKIYSVMNQAINMANAEYGDPSNWVIDCGSSGKATCSTNDVEDWFKSTIGKHLNILKIEPKSNQQGILVYFNDGGVLYIENCIYDMKFYLNQNVIKNSEDGKEVFQFRFNPIVYAHQSASSSDLTYVFKSTFEPYATYWDGTREHLINGHSFSCAQNHAFCAKLIQYDGWKISKDYPIKF